MSLFDQLVPSPLAERLRPTSLEDYAGQQHILAPGKPLRRQIERGELTSMILWGPPGVGKTTLARIIARHCKADFVPFSAVMSGIKEVKAVMEEAERARRLGRRTVIFVDEIHRFNKAQQDAFLPYVERGDVILIGATTENPSFEVNSALLSRCRVYALRQLTPAELTAIVDRGLTAMNVTAEPGLRAEIVNYANGDARAALNLVELAAAAATGATSGSEKPGEITRAAIEDALQRKLLVHDKSGEEHYNLISALHKSVRSSRPDAALYWLARLLEAGEDRLFIARRLVRMAIEDIGLADPRALEQAIAAKECVHFLGIPEGDQALAQVTIYLSVAPKSDAAYQALNAARQTVQSFPAEPVPMQIRNAPTRAMKAWGYGAGYEHAHSQPEAQTQMECMPDALSGTVLYEPTTRGIEQKIREKLPFLRSPKTPKTPPDEGEKT